MTDNRRHPAAPSPWYDNPLWVLVLMLIAVLAVVAQADEVRVQKRATVSSAEVTLGDVARLEGGVTEHTGLVVATIGRSGRAEVSLSQVRRALDDAGVHWGRVSLGGYASCAVRRQGGEETPPVPAPAPAPAAAATAHATRSAAALANPDAGDVRPEAPLTVRGLLIERIAARADADPADLEIAFNGRDAELLDASVYGQRYEVDVVSATGLGRVPVRLTRYDGVAIGLEEMVTARVSKRVLAAVATEPVARGRAYTGHAVELREVLIDEPLGEPVTDLSLLVGQHAARTVRAGDMLTASDVVAPRLVKRGEVVTVRCFVGDLVVRTVARATEDGAMGETIEVRRVDSRETYEAMVTGRREVAVEKPAAAEPDSEETAR